MKNYLWIVTTVVVVIFVGLRSHSALFFSINNHVCSASELLSDQHVASISEYIARDTHKNLSAQSLIVNVKKEFPVIKTMVISHKPLGAQVNIEPYEPICSINDLFVLTANNILLSKAVFSAEAFEMIPAVKVDTQVLDNGANLLTAFFDALLSDINNFYNLDFVNEHCIRLVDKNSPQFVVVLAAEQKNYHQLLERCAAIKKNLTVRGSFNRGMEWIADARFAHYIVAYKA